MALTGPVHHPTEREAPGRACDTNSMNAHHRLDHRRPNGDTAASGARNAGIRRSAPRHDRFSGNPYDVCKYRSPCAVGNQLRDACSPYGLRRPRQRPTTPTTHQYTCRRAGSSTQQCLQRPSPHIAESTKRDNREGNLEQRGHLDL